MVRSRGDSELEPDERGEPPGLLSQTPSLRLRTRTAWQCAGETSATLLLQTDARTGLPDGMRLPKELRPKSERDAEEDAKAEAEGSTVASVFVRPTHRPESPGKPYTDVELEQLERRTQRLRRTSALVTVQNRKLEAKMIAAAARPADPVYAEPSAVAPRWSARVGRLYVHKGTVWYPEWGEYLDDAAAVADAMMYEESFNHVDEEVASGVAGGGDATHE